MSWNPFKDVGHLVSSTFHSLEKLPGSPEALLGGLGKGFKGELSWNPYSGGKSVWDYIGAGSKLSDNKSVRNVGRTVGTLAGAYFGGGALMGAGGAGSAAAGAGSFAEGTSLAYGAGGAAGLGSSSLLTGGTLGTSAELAGGAAGFGLGEAAGAAGTAGTAGAAGGNSSALDGWLNMNGMGPQTWTAEGQGGFGGIGAAQSAGGSTYDQMLEYLKNKGGGLWNKASNMSGTNMFRTGAGIYGLMQSMQNRKNFRMPSAAEAQGSPGYKAGMDAVQASMAQQGYTGGSNAAAAIGKYGLDFYNQYAGQKMQAANMQSANGSSMLGSMALLAGGWGG